MPRHSWKPSAQHRPTLEYRVHSAEESQLSGVLLYFVAIGSPVLVDKHTVESLSGNSGGRVFYIPKAEPVMPYLSRIRTELSKQYYIGYYVSRTPGFHRIRVEIPKLNERARAAGLKR